MRRKLEDLSELSLIEEFKTSSMEVRDVLWKEVERRYNKFVTYLLKRWYGNSAFDPDILVDAQIGLLKAVDTYDPSRRIKVSTHIAKQIFWETQDGFHARVHSGMSSLREKASKMRKFIARIRSEERRYPSEYELCEHLGCSKEEIPVLKRMRSIDQPETSDGLQDANIVANGEMLPTLYNVRTHGSARAVTEEPDKRLVAIARSQKLEESIASLEERYRVVVRLRYYENLYYEAVAKRIGASREMTRQRDFAALKELRKMFRETFRETGDIL